MISPLDVLRADVGHGRQENGPACRLNPNGHLGMTGRCSAVMNVVGLLTGILSGLYGVGGGFVIVAVLLLALFVIGRNLAAPAAP